MPTAPNILFILSDQQRFDTLGCYAEPHLPPIRPDITPNLDAMAARGVRFRHAFTPQPLCGPARACLQSGMWPTQSGCVSNNFILPHDIPTLANAMNDAGYETAYVGKWHLASDKQHNHRTVAVPEPFRGGYRDYWMVADALEFTSSGYEGYFFDGQNRRVDWEGYRVDATANFVIDYLQQYATRKSEKPFFMFASFIEPHHQNDLDRYIGPIGSKQRFADYHVPKDLEGQPGDWQKHLPDYLGCCWSLDQNLGRIRETLKNLSLDENTIIIYTSDHGSHFRTRNNEYKRSCHEASIRIPMVAHGPGFTGGKTVDEMVSLIDMPPTILAAANAQIPDTMVGSPVQPLLTDGPEQQQAADQRDAVFVMISEDHYGRALRTRKWKYFISDPDARQPDGSRRHQADRYVEQFLYDLEADPYERNNLVASPQHADTRAQLAARLKRAMVEAGEPLPTIEPAPA